MESLRETRERLCVSLDESLHHYRSCFHFMQKGMQQTFRVAKQWRSAPSVSNLMRKLDQLDRHAV